MGILAAALLVSLGTYPIEEVRLTVAGVALPISTAIALLLVGLVVYRGFIIGQYLTLPSIHRRWMVLSISLVGAFLFATTVAMALSSCNKTTFETTKWLIYVVAFPFITIAMADLREEARWGLVLAGCIIAIIVGYYRFLSFEGGELSEHLLGYWGIRYTPATRNSDVLYPAVAATIALGLLDHRRGLAANTFLWFIAALSAVAVILTFSRSGWIAMVLAVAILLWARLVSLRFASTRLGLVALAGFIVGLFLIFMTNLPEPYPEALTARVTSIFAIDDATAGLSNVERLELYGSMLTVVLHNSTGVGLGNLNCVLRDPWVKVGHGENAYLTIAAEGGWVAIILFVSLLVWLGRMARRQTQGVSPEPTVNRALTVALLVLLAVYFLFNYEVNSLFVWAILALVAASASSKAVAFKHH